MNKVSCRKAFTKTLEQCAQSNDAVMLICTDSRGSVTAADFFNLFPNQAIEAGIAEQNAIGIAAGLATTNKTVFVAGPACFLAARGYEHIKVDVAYNQTNVKIIGVSGGVSYGPLGGTHTTLHDVASMRALPNIEVFIPSDAVQTQFLTQYLVQSNKPAYLRTGRGDVASIYNSETSFTPHQAKIVSDGQDATIIACGEMVYPALEAAKLLKKENLSIRVLDMFCLKPIDTESILRAAKETRAILTIEEHSIHGGLGEMVCAVTAQHHPTKIKVLGFPDEEYKVGSSGALFEYYGFTPEHIAQSMRNLLMTGCDA